MKKLLFLLLVLFLVSCQPIYYIVVVIPERDCPEVYEELYPEYNEGVYELQKLIEKYNYDGWDIIHVPDNRFTYPFEITDSIFLNYENKR